MELNAGGGIARAPRRSRSRDDTSCSPSSPRKFNVTQIMTRTSAYPASASRETPAVATPSRMLSSHHSADRSRQSASAFSAKASPLSPHELNVCTAPQLSAPRHRSSGSNSIKTGATAATTGTAAGGRCSSRNIAARDQQPAAVLHGPAGVTYAVRPSPHPLYTGTNGGNRNAAGSRMPPPAPLIISSDNDTVRGFRGRIAKSEPPAAAVASTLKRRKSLIERVAAAAGVESANAASKGATAVHAPPQPSNGVVHAHTGETQALAPLGLHDVIKMRLQPPPSNVAGEGASVQPLPADTLVLRPPEKTDDGTDNATFAQLSTFKMPQSGNGATSNSDGGAAAAATEGGVEASTLTATSSTLPPRPASTAPQPAGAAAAGTSPPPTSSEAASAGKLGEGATAAAAAATTTMMNTDASAAPPSQSSLHVLHASLRVPTSEEKAAAAEDRLVEDLVQSATQPKRQHAELNAWNRLNEPSYLELSSAAAAVPETATAADLAVLYVQEQLRQRRGLYGWQQPPPNVLLPSPSQPEATWAVPATAAAQSAQQAAAAQAIARADGLVGGEGSIRDGPHRLPPRTGGKGKVSGGPDLLMGAAAGAWCADYHAPFQAVLHPESVEHGDAIPDISGVVVDTSVTASMDAANEEAPVADAAGTTVKSFATQAVILRDPLSLLACEHLADDTVSIIARRRAYLTAMSQLDGALHGCALPPTSYTRPSALNSVLQPAAPPGEVFCQLSYPAKVLLSTVLYLRALGALPTLLRVGPLTEYSPVVDKENCIELVFYNPSDEECGQQQEQQRRRHFLEQQRSRESTAAFARAPQYRSHSATTSPVRVGERQQTCDLSPGSRPASALQRRPSAVESLLVQSLANAATRRSTSINAASSTAPPPLGGGANFTSLAEPRLRSAELSLLVEDAIDMATPASMVHRRPTFYESGSARLQPRSFSQEAASRVGPHQRPKDDTDAQQAKAAASGALRRQRRGTECCSAAAIPHLSRVSPLASPPPSTGPMSNNNSNNVSGGGGPLLRRSSVQVAVDDLKLRWASPAFTPAAEKPTTELNGSISSPTTLKGAPHPLLSAFESSMQFDTTLETVTAPARTASDGPRAAKPTHPHGAGNPRFPEGERELCVVLRAVVAQKSVVYAFGQSETVHVLPPLPSCSENDDVGDDVLLHKQMQEKKSVLEQLSVDTNDPLVKFLCGTSLRSGYSNNKSNSSAGNADGSRQGSGTPLERRKALLRERARQVAAAARRRLALVAVDASGKPVVDYGDLVVAFVLSKGASELSGSVPDMMELETLRYRIFSLQGYSTSDPSGMQAVRAAAAAQAETAAAAAAHPVPSSVDPHDSSPPDDALTRLQPQLPPYTDFQTNSASNVTTPGVGGDSHEFSPESSLSVEASMGLSRRSMRGLHRRASFFEDKLRKTDPLQARSNSNDVDGAVEYMSESDLQLLRQRQHRQRRAALQARYPIYRASSVAESTLQAFHAEAKAAVSVLRRRQRAGAGHINRATRGNGGMSAGRSNSSCSDGSDASRELLGGLGMTATVVTPSSGGSAAVVMDATAMLQETERDLLRFRPMNMNSFHRELVEALQYAIDLQTRQQTEKILHAFHM